MFTSEEKSAVFSAKLKSALTGHDAFRFAESHFAKVRHWDKIDQALAIDVKLLLPGNNLVKPDKMAMAVSLEPRSPFLDYRMIELAFRIPGILKFQDNTTKWIFKQAAERLLPKDIIYRKKRMHPIGEWFKDRLLPFTTKEVLQSKHTTDRGLFDAKAHRAP